MGICAMTTSRLRRSGMAGRIAAAVIATAAPVTANAAIVYDPINLTDRDGLVTVSLGGAPIFDLFTSLDKGNRYLFTNFVNGFAPITQTGVQSGKYFGDDVSKLAAGTVVDGSGAFTALGNACLHIDSAGTCGAFPTDGTGYFGFRFTPVGGATPDYGWGEVTFSLSGSFQTLDAIAYEDSGAPIVVGDGTPAVVPEPAAWALMVGGFGLVGTMTRRRRSVVAA